jgi:hypothetical protein
VCPGSTIPWFGLTKNIFGAVVLILNAIETSDWVFFVTSKAVTERFGLKSNRISEFGLRLKYVDGSTIA